MNIIQSILTIWYLSTALSRKTNLRTSNPLITTNHSSDFTTCKWTRILRNHHRLLRPCLAHRLLIRTGIMVPKVRKRTFQLSLKLTNFAQMQTLTRLKEVFMAPTSSNLSLSSQEQTCSRLIKHLSNLPQSIAISNKTIQGSPKIPYLTLKFTEII